METRYQGGYSSPEPSGPVLSPEIDFLAETVIRAAEAKVMIYPNAVPHVPVIETLGSSSTNQQQSDAYKLRAPKGWTGSVSGANYIITFLHYWFDIFPSDYITSILFSSYWLLYVVCGDSPFFGKRSGTLTSYRKVLDNSNLGKVRSGRYIKGRPDSSRSWAGKVICARKSIKLSRSSQLIKIFAFYFWKYYLRHKILLMLAFLSFQGLHFRQFQKIPSSMKRRHLHLTTYHGILLYADLRASATLIPHPGPSMPTFSVSSVLQPSNPWNLLLCSCNELFSHLLNLIKCVEICEKLSRKILNFHIISTGDMWRAISAHKILFISFKLLVDILRW